jgi:hypothetical protein
MPRLPILYLVGWRAPRDERGAVAHGVKEFRQGYYETPERFRARVLEFAGNFHNSCGWAAIIDAQSYQILAEYGTRFAGLAPMLLPLKRKPPGSSSDPRERSNPPCDGPRQSALPPIEGVKSATA